MTSILERSEFPDSLVEAVSRNSDRLDDTDFATGIPSFVRKADSGVVKIAVPTLFYLDEAQLEYFAHDFEVATSEAAAELRRQYSRFELLQLLLAHSIGSPMSIVDVRDGRVVQDIIPKECKTNVADSSHGSTLDFSFHNDMSYLDDEQTPDYFSLGCIRNNEKAITSIADPFIAMKLLDEDSIAELQKTQYTFRHVYRRGREDEAVGKKVSPVITPDGEVRLGVDMESPTLAALDALTRFRGALGSVAVDCVLSTGDVLVIPNRHFVHGRRAFSMAPDPTQRRWIQRINIAT